MEYLKDIDNRYGSPSGMIAAYGWEDLANIEQCLRILRYRMLGKTWEEIGIIEKERHTTLYQRMLALFGPMIAKYNFKDASRLPKEYRELYGGNPSLPEFSTAAANAEKYVWVSKRELWEYKDEIQLRELKADFKMKLKEKTGVDWDTAIRLQYWDSFGNLYRIVDASPFTVSTGHPPKYEEIDDNGPFEWAEEERHKIGMDDFKPYNPSLFASSLVELHKVKDPFWKKFYWDVEGIRVPCYDR